MSGASYVILSSKPGRFRTELVEGLRPVETWDYSQFGRTRALFVIAELERPVKIRIVDETPPEVVNQISSKVLPRFGSVAEARRSLAPLAAGDGSLRRL